MNNSFLGRLAAAFTVLIVSVGALMATPTSAMADGWYLAFRNEGTGNFLDSNEWGEVYSIPGNGSPTQRWGWRYEGWGTEGLIQNTAVNGPRCLDHNEALGRITTSPCDPNNDFQKWRAWEDGTVQNKKTHKCLDNNTFMGKFAVVPADCDYNNAYKRWWN